MGAMLSFTLLYKYLVDRWAQCFLSVWHISTWQTNGSKVFWQLDVSVPGRRLGASCLLAWHISTWETDGCNVVCQFDIYVPGRQMGAMLSVSLTYNYLADKWEQSFLTTRFVCTWETVGSKLSLSLTDDRWMQCCLSTWHISTWETDGRNVVWELDVSVEPEDGDIVAGIWL